MFKIKTNFFVFLILVVALLLSACSGGGEIRTGQWEGESDFGSFGFTVNPEGTTITYLEYEVPTCGNYSFEGKFEGAWEGIEIVDGSFNFSSGGTFSLSGTFDKSGESASGNWRFSPSDCNLSGSWNAAAIP